MKIVLILVALFAIGCEIDTEEPGEAAATSQSQTTTAQPQNTTAATTDSTVSAEQAEWDAISWNGNSCKGATKVMSLSASITGDRSKVNFSFSSYPWSDMGLGHFFVWDGTRWKGGKFDWIRTGGQSTKLLENVHNGYNGLHAPASGTPCAFAWTNEKGDQRSNLAYATWP